MTSSRTSRGISSRFDGRQFVVEPPQEEQIYELEYLVAVLLVAVARSDGDIAPSETDKMLQLVGDYFHLRSSTSLDLLTRAMKNLTVDPGLPQLLRGWSSDLTLSDKEDIAVMMLKVVDADGKRDVQEMAMMHRAAKIIEISPESVHIAFNRVFDEADKS